MHAPSWCEHQLELVSPDARPTGAQQPGTVVVHFVELADEDQLDAVLVRHVEGPRHLRCDGTNDIWR